LSVYVEQVKTSRLGRFKKVAFEAIFVVN